MSESAATPEEPEGPESTEKAAGAQAVPARPRLPSHFFRLLRASLGKFYADRGTHLAAMCAYYTLLSVFPLLFLSLALLGLFGRQHEDSLLVHALAHILPGTPLSSIVDGVAKVQAHATLFGLAGIAFFIWSSLGLFSVLESACNLVYRLPNRSFWRGKALALGLMSVLLLLLMAALTVGSLGYDLLAHYASGAFGSPYFAYPATISVSFLGVFAVLLAVYYTLPNTQISLGEAWPGALVAALALETTFQALPLYLRLSENVVSWQALGGPIILLVWLYFMANLLVFGCEINWARAHGNGETTRGKSAFLGDV